MRGAGGMGSEWQEVRLGGAASINPDSIGSNWHFISSTSISQVWARV